MIHPQNILDYLLTAEPVPTEDMPSDSVGIYALADHEGTLSYIGSTSAENESFRKRIHQRHRTGSESHSHYYSKIYNTGRMWRDPSAQRNHPDATISKRLRNAFIAEYCRAVCFPIDRSIHNIPRLEADVIRLAPREITRWNENTGLYYDEPIELVDVTIEKLHMTIGEREALLRQASLCRNRMFQ